MFPKVFTLEETKARHQFHKWYNTFFVTSSIPSDYFPEGFSTNQLLECFTASYPNTILTSSILTHVLMYGGYMDAKQDRVHMDIRLDTLEYMPEACCRVLLRYCNTNLSVKLAQSMSHNANIITAVKGVNFSTWAFWQAFVFSKKTFRHWHKLPKALNRTSITVCYTWYQLFCTLNSYKPADSDVFKKEMTMLGATINKGYFNGVGGIAVYNNIAIPEPECWDRCLDIGFGILQGYFNDNVYDQWPTEESFNNYIKQRRLAIEKFKSGNTQTKEIFTGLEETSDRAAVEIRASFIRNKKETIASEDLGSADSGYKQEAPQDTDTTTYAVDPDDIELAHVEEVQRNFREYDPEILEKLKNQVKKSLQAGEVLEEGLVGDLLWDIDSQADVTLYWEVLKEDEFGL